MDEPSEQIATQNLPFVPQWSLLLAHRWSLIGALIGLGVRQSNRSSSPVPGAEGMVNWDAPLTDGVGVPASQALRETTIPAFVPRGLGKPAYVYVDNPDHYPPNDRDEVFVYHQDAYGHFFVLEQPRKRNEADLEAVLTQNSDPGSSTRFELIQLSGRPAILQRGPGSVRGLFYLDSGRKVMPFDVTFRFEQVSPLSEPMPPEVMDLFHGMPLRRVGSVVQFKFDFWPEEPSLSLAWVALYRRAMFVVSTGPEDGGASVQAGIAPDQHEPAL